MSTPPRANLDTAACFEFRYDLGMLETWLAKAIDTSGLSQAELSRRLSVTVGRSIDRAAVNKMVMGKREMAADEMFAIAQITRVPPPDPDNLYEAISVPLVGRVGAGATMDLYSEAHDTHDRVRPPSSGATEHTVAVEIVGDSLGQAFNRWIIYYDRRSDPPTKDMLNQLCVVGLTDGRVLVKTLTEGGIKGRYTLKSDFAPPIYDAEVDWAALVKQMTPR